MSFSLPLTGSSKDFLKVLVFTRLLRIIYGAGQEFLFVQQLRHQLPLLQSKVSQSGKMFHDNRDTSDS